MGFCFPLLSNTDLRVQDPLQISDHISLARFKADPGKLFHVLVHGAIKVMVLGQRHELELQ